MYVFWSSGFVSFMRKQKYQSSVLVVSWCFNLVKPRVSLQHHSQMYSLKLALCHGCDCLNSFGELFGALPSQFTH